MILTITCKCGRLYVSSGRANIRCKCGEYLRTSPINTYIKGFFRL